MTTTDLRARARHAQAPHPPPSFTRLSCSKDIDLTERCGAEAVCTHTRLKPVKNLYKPPGLVAGQVQGPLIPLPPKTRLIGKFTRLFIPPPTNQSGLPPSPALSPPSVNEGQSRVTAVGLPKGFWTNTLRDALRQWCPNSWLTNSWEVVLWSLMKKQFQVKNTRQLRFMLYLRDAISFNYELNVKLIKQKWQQIMFKNQMNIKIYSWDQK